jgi:hypothetical protein
MDIPKVYLETTMFSMYHGQEATPEYRQHKADARALFDLIKSGKYEPYTSIYAIEEIDTEPDEEKREKMRGLIPEYGVKVLDSMPEIERIADLYIQERAIPESHPIDADHIAITTVNGLDFIVSFNFTHIARPWTIERVRRVNGREGYKGIGIYRPAEVLEL